MPTQITYDRINIKFKKMVRNMNKVFKISVMLFSAFLFISGCIKQNNGNNIINIGIIQTVEHRALDECRKGFIEELSNEGFDLGVNTHIDYLNAQGDQSNCTAIANKFVNSRMDLVLAIATPAAQSMVNISSKIPIVVGCVTDPKSAGLIENNSKSDLNVTGVSDLPPIDKQIGLIKEILPNVKKLGIFYCANEENSRYQADIAVIEAKRLKLDPFIYTVSQLSEVKSIFEYMINNIDAVYIPTDNMMASASDTIADIAGFANKAVVCGDVNLVEKGFLGTYGIDYFTLGEISARQAIKIIKGTPAKDIPIDYVKEGELVLNSSVIKNLNIQIPDHIIKKAKML